MPVASPTPAMTSTAPCATTASDRAQTTPLLRLPAMQRWTSPCRSLSPSSRSRRGKSQACVRLSPRSDNPPAAARPDRCPQARAQKQGVIQRPALPTSPPRPAFQTVWRNAGCFAACLTRPILPAKWVPARASPARPDRSPLQAAKDCRYMARIVVVTPGTGNATVASPQRGLAPVRCRARTTVGHAMAGDPAGQPDGAASHLNRAPGPPRRMRP